MSEDGWNHDPFDPNNPETSVTNGTAIRPGLDAAANAARHAEWIAQNPALANSGPMKYNYADLNMTEADRRAAQGDEPAQAPGDIFQDEGWAANATVYEWQDEYGDIGPAHPELERQLFGSDVHVTTGIDFSTIASIEVVQEGTIRIQPVRSFDHAGLHPVMLENVRLAGYNVPTPVQAYTMPAILKGYDVVACAQTGSGKTASFLIPTLSKLMGKAKKLCAPRPNPATFVPSVHEWFRAEPLLLVVCPNRELAVQIFNEARRFCYRSMLRPCVVYGGGPRRDQLEQIAKGCDVLIGTPGRLVDFITNEPNRLSLCRLKYTIIDEADEMLGADWEKELDIIMNGGDQEMGNITYMMFSATFPKAARSIAQHHLAHDYVRIRVGRAGSTHMNIEQNIVYVDPSAKRQALLDLLYSRPPARTIVFVNSKRAADEIDDFLYNLGMPSSSIHSDRTQREREDALRAFRVGNVAILVATGVSARGLDIKNVMHVINFDLPSASYGGIEEYTHRIGRTGRIGNKGLATSFYYERNEDIAQQLVMTLLETKQPVPDFLEQYVPEGGDLRFEDDSDFGEDAGGGWGAGDDAGAGAAEEVPAQQDLINVDDTPAPVAPSTGTLPGTGPAPAAAPSTGPLPGVRPAPPVALPTRTFAGTAPAPAGARSTGILSDLRPAAAATKSVPVRQPPPPPQPAPQPVAQPIYDEW